MKYDPTATPFWEKEKSGPVSEWQTARDYAEACTELEQLDERIELLSLQLNDTISAVMNNDQVEKAEARYDAALEERRRMLNSMPKNPNKPRSKRERRPRNEVAADLGHYRLAPVVATIAGGRVFKS